MAKTTTKTESSIPPEFMAYFQNMMDRAEANSNRQYQGYSGERIADWSPDSLEAQRMVRSMAGAGLPNTTKAIDITRGNAAAAGGIGKAPSYQFSEYGYDDPRMFDAAAANEYMSPYMQSVVDSNKAHALEDFQTQDAARNGAAVAAGAFGGSRQAQMQGLAERDYLTRASDIQSAGNEKAYEDAQRMFTADRTAMFDTDKARAAELARVQSGQSAEDYNRSLLGLDALRFKGDQAQQMSDLELQRRNAKITSAQLLDASGNAQGQRDQAGLDLGYQDFLRQQNYGTDQIGNYANILHGLPIAATGTDTQTTTQHTNPLQQLFGAGISALGLYNAWKK